MRIALFTVAGAVVALAPGRALGQRADPLPGAGWKPATSHAAIPRTPWGDPDISGMYEPGHIQQPAEVPVGERWTKPQGPAQPTDFGARDQAYSDPTRKQIPLSMKPFVVDPPDGKIPMQPWVRAKRKEIYDNHYTEKIEFMDPRIRCLQAGVPRAQTPVYYNSYQIVQRPGAVMIIYEWNHMTRIITLDGSRPPLDPRIRLPMGDSRGRWEGNVLVVETTNFSDDTWVLGHGAGPRDGQPAETASTGHGIVHSDEYRVVERFVPIDGDIIRYEATISDPKAFTRPWTISFDAMGRGRPDHQIFEYACHEGNRDGMLLMTGFDIDPSQAKK